MMHVKTWEIQSKTKKKRQVVHLNVAVDDVCIVEVFDP